MCPFTPNVEAVGPARSDGPTRAPCYEFFADS